VEVAAAEDGAGEVGALEVGLFEVAGVEFGGLEAGEAELGVAEVAFGEEDLLAVGLAGGEAGETAMVEFDAGEVEASGGEVGEVAVGEADVFEGDRTELGLGEVDAGEFGAFDVEGAVGGTAVVVRFEMEAGEVDIVRSEERGGVDWDGEVCGYFRRSTGEDELFGRHTSSVPDGVETVKERMLQVRRRSSLVAARDVGKLDLGFQDFIFRFEAKWGEGCVFGYCLAGGYGFFGGTLRVCRMALRLSKSGCCWFAGGRVWLQRGT